MRSGSNKSGVLPPVTKKITQKVDLTAKSSHRLSQTGQAVLSKDISERVHL